MESGAQAGKRGADTSGVYLVSAGCPAIREESASSAPEYPKICTTSPVDRCGSANDNNQTEGHPSNGPRHDLAAGPLLIESSNQICPPGDTSQSHLLGANFVNNNAQGINNSSINFLNHEEEHHERKSSISFDKIKQISLTYSLQSDETNEYNEPNNMISADHDPTEQVHSSGEEKSNQNQDQESPNYILSSIDTHNKSSISGETFAQLRERFGVNNKPFGELSQIGSMGEATGREATNHTSSAEGSYKGLKFGNEVNYQQSSGELRRFISSPQEELRLRQTSDTNTNLNKLDNNNLNGYNGNGQLQSSAAGRFKDGYEGANVGLLQRGPPAMVDTQTAYRNNNLVGFYTDAGNDDFDGDLYLGPRRGVGHAAQVVDGSYDYDYGYDYDDDEEEDEDEDEDDADDFDGDEVANYYDDFDDEDEDEQENYGRHLGEMCGGSRAIATTPSITPTSTQNSAIDFRRGLQARLRQQAREEEKSSANYGARQRGEYGGNFRADPRSFYSGSGESEPNRRRARDGSSSSGRRRSRRKVATNTNYDDRNPLANGRAGMARVEAADDDSDDNNGPSARFSHTDSSALYNENILTNNKTLYKINSSRRLTPNSNSNNPFYMESHGTSRGMINAEILSPLNDIESGGFNGRTTSPLLPKSPSQSAAATKRPGDDLYGFAGSPADNQVGLGGRQRENDDHDDRDDVFGVIANDYASIRTNCRGEHESPDDSAAAATTTTIRDKNFGRDNSTIAGLREVARSPVGRTVNLGSGGEYYVKAASGPPSQAAGPPPDHNTAADHRVDCARANQFDAGLATMMIGPPPPATPLSPKSLNLSRKSSVALELDTLICGPIEARRKGTSVYMSDGGRGGRTKAARVKGRSLQFDNDATPEDNQEGREEGAEVAYGRVAPGAAPICAGATGSAIASSAGLRKSLNMVGTAAAGQGGRRADQGGEGAGQGQESGAEIEWSEYFNSDHCTSRHHQQQQSQSTPTSINFSTSTNNNNNNIINNRTNDSPIRPANNNQSARGTLTSRAGHRGQFSANRKGPVSISGRASSRGHQFTSGSPPASSFDNFSNKLAAPRSTEARNTNRDKTLVNNSKFNSHQQQLQSQRRYNTKRYNPGDGAGDDVIGRRRNGNIIQYLGHLDADPNDEMEDDDYEWQRNATMVYGTPLRNRQLIYSRARGLNPVESIDGMDQLRATNWTREFSDPRPANQMSRIDIVVNSLGHSCNSSPVKVRYNHQSQSSARFGDIDFTAPAAAAAEVPYGRYQLAGAAGQPATLKRRPFGSSMNHRNNNNNSNNNNHNNININNIRDNPFYLDRKKNRPPESRPNCCDSSSEAAAAYRAGCEKCGSRPKSIYANSSYNDDNSYNFSPLQQAYDAGENNGRRRVEQMQRGGSSSVLQPRRRRWRALEPGQQLIGNKRLLANNKFIAIYGHAAKENIDKGSLEYQGQQRRRHHNQFGDINRWHGGGAGEQMERNERANKRTNQQANFVSNSAIRFSPALPASGAAGAGPSSGGGGGGCFSQISQQHNGNGNGNGNNPLGMHRAPVSPSNQCTTTNDEINMHQQQPNNSTWEMQTNYNSNTKNDTNAVATTSTTSTTNNAHQRNHATTTTTANSSGTKSDGPIRSAGGVDFNADAGAIATSNDGISAAGKNNKMINIKERADDLGKTCGPSVSCSNNDNAPTNNNQAQANKHQLRPQPAAREIHKLKGSARPIKLKNLTNGEETLDTLHNSASDKTSLCLAALYNPPHSDGNTLRGAEETLEQAQDFIKQFYQSIKRLDSPAYHNRIAEIEQQLRNSGRLYLKETELIFGAKLAWRNTARCIGRIQWSKLQVFDARFTTNCQEMFEAICNHIKYATNKGKLRSAITVFPERTKSTKNDWRIWNNQLIGYAGYKDEKTGKVVGDPANCEITAVAQRLGWQGKGTRFDVLPLVLSAAGGPPQVFPLPEELVLRVKIVHPKYEWFQEMGLEWYALPAVANMMLDLGGLQFTAAPFSGWYMVTEIGTRDLGDPHRYNVLEEVAQRMGLNTTSNASLWKDKATVELNHAVLYSYQSAGVTIVDHHTACETFMTHLQNEQRLRGGCPADWVWLVPPISGSLTQVFHQEMVNYHLLPNYEYMDPIWKNYDWVSHDREAEDRQNRLAKLSQSPLRADGVVKSSAEKMAIIAQSPPGRLLSNTNNGNSPNLNELTPKRMRFKEIARAVKFTSKLFGKALSRRIKATILYATETGKSERFANKLAQTFSCAFNVHLMTMSDYDMTCLEHEALLLIVSSTFGNGDPPENGELFAKHLAAMKITGESSPDIESINSVATNPFFKMMSEDNTGPDCDNLRRGTIALDTGADIRPLSNVRFGVFALGSTAYPHYCAFGRYVDQILGELGAERITRCALGDELCGQEKAFNEWSNEIFKRACEVFCMTDYLASGIEDRQETVWSPQDVKFLPVEIINGNDQHESAAKSISQLAGSAAAAASASASDSSKNRIDVNINTSAGKIANIASANETEIAAAESSTATCNLATTDDDVIPSSNKANEIMTSRKTIIRNLTSISGKKIVPFVVKRRFELHRYKIDENVQTFCLELYCDRILGPKTGGPSPISGSPGVLSPMHQSQSSPSLKFRQSQSMAGYFMQQQLINENQQQQQQQAAAAPASASASPSPQSTTLQHQLSKQLSQQLPASSEQQQQQYQLHQQSSPQLQIAGQFQPGDHVAIYPTNNPEMVEKIIRRMKSDYYAHSADSKGPEFDFDQVFTILVKRENMDLTPATTVASDTESTQWIPHDRLPITSIREALMRYLDITSPPNQEFLLILARHTSDQVERKRLNQIGRNFTVYEEWKNHKSPNLGTLLDEFKTCKFQPAMITQIPLLKPRFYSVSGTSIALTVGVVRYKTAANELRDGLCSTYLLNAPIDSVIYGYIRSAPAFHMLQDESTPMLLISAGTGIAPFRSFWQQRLADMHLAAARGQESKSFGRIKLYFGCRNSDYILYKDELEEMHRLGVLDSIHIGFSRPKKCDVLEEGDSDIINDQTKQLSSDNSTTNDNKSSESESTTINKTVSTLQTTPTTTTTPNHLTKSPFKIADIRQANKKTYVQDKLVEDREDIYQLIMNEGAHVYVCGDVSMADGVYKQLASIFNNHIKEKQQNVNSIDQKDLTTSLNQQQLQLGSTADEILMNLRNLNRYHEDIFGAKQVS